MHDDEDRHGWRTVRVDGTWVEGYRGRTPQEVVRTRWDVPVSADGVAELAVVVPGLGPGPTGTDPAPERWSAPVPVRPGRPRPTA